MAGRYWNATDEDGHCTRCGLLWEDAELDGSIQHECPPGFWRKPGVPDPGAEKESDA